MHRAVKIGEEVGVPRISVCNVVGSLIARSTGLGVYLNAGREHAVASTKAFTTQVRAGKTFSYTSLYVTRKALVLIACPR